MLHPRARGAGAAGRARRSAPPRAARSAQRGAARASARPRALAAVAGAVARRPVALAALPLAGRGSPAPRSPAPGARRARYPAAAPLDRIARAVCDAYVALGELRPEAAASLVFEPRASGYLRCRLRDATPEEAARVTAALDALLGPVERPRYLISRLVAPPDPWPRRRCCGSPRAAADALATAWHAVPDDLGRRKERAEALAAAWRRWLGPAELRFTQRDGPGPRGARRGRRAGVELRHAAARRLA